MLQVTRSLWETWLTLWESKGLGREVGRVCSVRLEVTWEEGELWVTEEK